MEFLKKHYEKVILSIVLLLLAVAAAYLPIRVAAVNKNIEDEIIGGAPKPFIPLDISTNIATLNRARKSQLKLSGPEHNLFNPVGWVKSKEGNLLKDPFYGRKGPEALVLTNTVPLYFRVKYDRLVQDGDEIKYYFGVTREAETKRRDRRLVTRVIRARDKNDIFILKEVKGAPTQPEGFVITLLADNREIFVSCQEPYSEIAGYTADLVYPPEGGKKFNARRRGDKITIAKKSYEVVVVLENEVVIKDTKTTKQTTVRLNASE
ncbi:MAG: hypothetical protein M2R45_02111 [Verrucomicrobia subdivision 3 bacterium]|nr:hypothetical protein [Limisphaerales bacterium]MCS1413830.1 hypothetical protein [Limisphaerales bacterium]